MTKKTAVFFIIMAFIAVTITACGDNNSDGQTDGSEKISVGGKEYVFTHFGEQDLTEFDIDFTKREFRRLENAYEDFKNNPATGDVLPYHNFPVETEIETGQVFVIDYTDKNGSVSRKYYRSDGNFWNDYPIAQEFILE